MEYAGMPGQNAAASAAGKRDKKNNQGKKETQITENKYNKQ